MKKVIKLGKIAYTGKRRINSVEIEIGLTEGRLSICGAIWNGSHTDCFSCGQNLDEIANLFPKNSQVQKLHSIWERWHLNDMKAGSPAQEEYLRGHSKPFPGYPANHFEWASKVLADVGLNPDPNHLHNGKPYVYGTAWLKEELPADVVAYIEAL